MSALAFLWMLQAAGPSPAPDGPCLDDPNAIVVCGKSHQPSPRLPTLPDSPVPEQTSILPRADFKIFGNSHLSFDAGSANVGGWQSKRLMATIRIPLGGNH